MSQVEQFGKNFAIRTENGIFIIDKDLQIINNITTESRELNVNPILNNQLAYLYSNQINFYQDEPFSLDLYHEFTGFQFYFHPSQLLLHNDSDIYVRDTRNNSETKKLCLSNIKDIKCLDSTFSIAVLTDSLFLYDCRF